MAKVKTKKKDKFKKSPKPRITHEINKPTFFQNYWAYILLTVVFLAVAIIRLRLLHVPLERDEGEYAYFGQLILQGIMPYDAAYNMKFPGVYFFYAFFMLLFGESVAAVHLGLLLVNLASLLFLFLILRRLSGDISAIAGAAIFGLLSATDTVLGFAGHATHFVSLAALGGFWVALLAFEKQKFRWYFLAGVLFGLAPVFKQAGAFFSLFGAFLLLLHQLIIMKSNWKLFVARFGIFVAGGVTPFLMIV